MSLEEHIEKKRRELNQRALELPEAYTPENYAEFVAIRQGLEEIGRLEQDFLAHKKRAPTPEDVEELLY